MGPKIQNITFLQWFLARIRVERGEKHARIRILLIKEIFVMQLMKKNTVFDEAF